MDTKHKEVITWESEFSVGVPALDEQHKKLIALINRLHAARVEKKASLILTEVMDDLIEYAEYHFAYEEKLLDESGYPHSESHKQQHKQLFQLAWKFRQSADAVNVALADKFITFMKSWLREHILKSDMSYSAHLAAGSCE